MVPQSDGNNLALSAELLPPLTIYAAMLSTLASSLPATVLQTLFRKIATAIQDYLYARVATSKVFSAAGGAQFLDDVQYGWEQASRDNKIRRPEAGMGKIKDAAVLLSLPSGEVSSGFSLAKLVAAAWESDSKFAEVGQLLGLQAITRKEAQAVLKKRPECWRA